MQRSFFTSIILSLIILGMTGCSDDKTTPPASITDIHFSIKFNPVFKRDGQYELIVLSTDNKLLGKQRITRAVTGSIHVPSPTKTVNVVIIDTLRFPGGGVRYNMMAFMNVSPSTWEIFPPQPIVDAPSITDGSVTYLNMPDIPDENLYFVNTMGLPWSSQLVTELDAAIVYYHGVDNDYSYMLIPGLGKYKFTKMVTRDPIDASSLETAVKVKLTGQPASMFHSCRLVGYPENGNFNKQLAIYPESIYFNYSDFDYMYPENHFAHYELFYGGLDGRAHHDYYALSTTAPTSVSLFDESQHQLTQDDLQINLSYQTKIPTLTNLWLTYNNIDLFVSCPSELSSFKYDELVRNLQSELLPRTAPYRFKLEQYQLISVTPFGYVDYQNFLYSPEQKQKQVTQEIQFLKDLRY